MSEHEDVGCKLNGRFDIGRNPHFVYARLGSISHPLALVSVRTMRYVRALEDTKRAAVEAIKLSQENVQVLASCQKQPATALAVSH